MLRDAFWAPARTIPRMQDNCVGPQTSQNNVFVICCCMSQCRLRGIYLSSLTCHVVSHFVHWTQTSVDTETVTRLKIKVLQH